MKTVSIITVVYNNEATIAQAIRSVIEQTYPQIEYIIIDGKSTDGTVATIEPFVGKGVDKFVSESDNGLYDAMNKGIGMATGDIIGILNSDDIYEHREVIEHVVNAFETHDTDSVFGDLVLVDPNNIQKIVRYYRSNRFKVTDFRRGMMPPHATFFVKTEHYRKLGLFNTNYKISADFDLMLRFLYIAKLRYIYLPEVLIRMRLGGISTSGLSSTYLMNKENLAICRKHSVRTNILNIYSKYFFKVFQYFRRPEIPK